ncbi:exonuclease SbcCD subunit D [Motilimonas cestriensis]|uniref:Nuclease SbcCD subunit D n=1 Tax=Motilimonas cestriensis TaxID=2742685 RepID=A0ABS8W9B6_9GAMM|nr:exonuclease SbcCD subunit D [Motilimonas cestriensis]MCE2594394.1 exonuclease SbcCD subunit D [Motilimonas cestriensis]
MKFIHTSDWHLGRQLHNQSLLDDQRHVLNQIIELAQQHHVDAVVVAGDIYDRSVPPAQAVSLLNEVLTTLVKELAIPVVMIAGNHDGAERLGFASAQMIASGLHITGPLNEQITPVVIKGRSGVSAAFYSLPYVEPATVRSVFDTAATSHQEAMQVLLEQVQQQIDASNNKVKNVVVSHCFLDGGEESESERPLSIGGADKIAPNLFSEFDYVALGHLHGPQYKGQPHVRYSGSILKYSFSEQHQNKSVTLVELADNAPAQVELLPLTPLRDVRIIEGFLADIIASSEQDSALDDYIMVRLLDKTAILDVIGKIRQVYPNVLHIERTGLMAESAQLERRTDHIKKGEMAMFSDFFSQVQGEALSEQQQACINATLDELHQQEQSQ